LQCTGYSKLDNVRRIYNEIERQGERERERAEIQAERSEYISAASICKTEE
jgi:hypothetical protein